MKFKTERLVLREFTQDDFQNLLELDSDPQVMKFINGGIGLTEDQVRATLNRILTRQKETPETAIWAAETIATGEFIGWFCMKPLPQSTDCDVGYRLLRRFWGQGFATEGARAMVAHGFQLGLEKLYAMTSPGHVVSQRVLQKVGFVPTGPGLLFSPLENKNIPVEWFEQSRK